MLKLNEPKLFSMKTGKEMKNQEDIDQDKKEDCMTCKFKDCEYKLKGEWCMEWEIKKVCSIMSYDCPEREKGGKVCLATHNCGYQRKLS